MGDYFTGLNMPMSLGNGLPQFTMPPLAWNDSTNSYASLPNMDMSSLMMPQVDTKKLEAEQKKRQAEQKAKEAKQKADDIAKLQQALKDNAAQKQKAEQEKQRLQNKVKSQSQSEHPRGFWNNAWSVCKGVAKSVTGMFTDEKGNFSLSKTLTTVAVGAVAVAADAATGGALTPVLIGLGAVMGGAQAVKGGIDIANAKTAADEEKAYEEMGEGAGTLLLSIGGKFASSAKAAKAEKLAAGIEDTMNILKDSEYNSKAAESIKALKSLKAGGKDLFADAMADLRNSKGNQTNMKSALSRLETLTKNKPELQDLHTNIADALGSISKKGKVLDNETIVSELKNFKSLVKGRRNSRKLNSLIERLTKSSNEKDAMKACEEAKTLVSRLNKTGNNNTLEALLEQRINPVKKPFGTRIKDLGSKLKENAGIEGHKVRTFIVAPVMANIIPANIGSINAEEERKAQQEVELQKINDKISESDAQIKKSKDVELEAYALMAAEYDIIAQNNDTVDTLKKKIEDAKKQIADKEKEEKAEKEKETQHS